MWTIKKLIVSALLAISLNSTASAEINGSLWNTLDQEQKTFLAAGLLQGANLGSSLTSMGCYNEPTHSAESSATCSFLAQKSYKIAWDKYIKQTDTAQLSTGLDTFYSEFRNMKISLSEASFIILRQIAQENMDIYIENARALSN